MNTVYECYIFGKQKWTTNWLFLRKFRENKAHWISVVLRPEKIGGIEGLYYLKFSNIPSALKFNSLSRPEIVEFLAEKFKVFGRKYRVNL